MATTKAAAPATVDVAKQLKAAVGVFASSQKELARKDKTITKLQAQITKLEAKTNGGVAPAVKRGRKAASADDADAPVAKRVKATAAPVAEPKKRGPKAAAPAKKSRSKSDEDFLV
jgi:ABC-type transporter Mla subunit MlaD